MNKKLITKSVATLATLTTIAGPALTVAADEAKAPVTEAVSTGAEDAAVIAGTDEVKTSEELKFEAELAKIDVESKDSLDHAYEVLDQYETALADTLGTEVPDATKTELQTNLDKLRKDLANLHIELSDAKAKAANVDKEIAALGDESKLDDAGKTKLAELKKQKGEADTKVKNTQEKVDQVVKQIEELTKQLTGATSTTKAPTTGTTGAPSTQAPSTQAPSTGSTSKTSGTTATTGTTGTTKAPGTSAVTTKAATTTTAAKAFANTVAPTAPTTQAPQAPQVQAPAPQESPEEARKKQLTEEVNRITEELKNDREALAAATTDADKATIQARIDVKTRRLAEIQAELVKLVGADQAAQITGQTQQAAATENKGGQAQLPRTGDTGSFAAVIGSAITGLGSFLGFRRKK